jgi:hypothetical protein
MIETWESAKRHTAAEDVLKDIIPVSVQPQFFLTSRSGQTQPDFTQSGAPLGLLPVCYLQI